MDIKIEISESEKLAVIGAISQLTKIRHITYMSQAMIAEIAGMKATKVRATLQELVDTDVVTQYVVSAEGRTVRRFYYTLNLAGGKQQQL